MYGPPIADRKRHGAIGLIALAVITCLHAADGAAAGWPAHEPGLFRWQQARSACPRALDIEKRIHELAGPAHDEALAADLIVWASAQRRPDGRWFISLTPNRPRRDLKRVLIGQSCREVAEAAALVVAFMLGPGEADAGANHPQEAERAETLSAPSSETELPTAAAPDEVVPTPESGLVEVVESAPPSDAEPLLRDTSPTPPDKRAPHATMRVSLALTGEHGLIPGVVTGPALGLDFSWGGIGVELLGSLGLPGPAGAAAAREGDMTTWSTQAGACGQLWRLGGWQQRVCLGFAGNVVRARVREADADTTVVATLWGPYAGTTLALRCLGRFETFIRLGVTVPVARPRFSLDRLGDFRGSHARLQAAAGVAAHF